MRSLRRWLSVLLVAACASYAAAGGAQSSNPVEQLSSAQLLSALKAGGYVLYFRHTSTDFGQNDNAMKSFEDCANQRNLLDKGRAEARRIGAAVKRLELPIGEVMASPYCRTVETATLAFGRARKMPEARGGPVQSADSERYAGLRALLSTPPMPGSNNVVVSHGNPFHALAGPPYLAEGEAAVLRPLGNSRFEVVAPIRLDDWDRLAAALPRRSARSAAALLSELS